MKYLYTLFILLVLLSGSFAVSSADLNMFIFNYLKGNETFTKTPFNLSDGEYCIVSIGEPALIIRATASGGMQVISDRDGIKKALAGYYATQGITSDELVMNKSYSDEILSFIDSFNSSRKIEFGCKKYIGIDRFECIDLDSCWRACYTPICQQMKIGAGKPFLELIWKFSNLSRYIDSNYSSFRDKFGSISEWKSQEQIDELIALVDNMKNDSVSMGNSDLFDPMALGFCPVLDSDISYLIQARIRLVAKKGKVAQLLTLDETAERIFNNTMSRTAGLPEKESCSSAVSRNMLEVSYLKDEFSTLNNTRMNERLAELEKLAELGGCGGMNESQISSASQNFSNFSQQTEEYGSSLKVVLEKKNEVKSALDSMQGDVLLSFKLGEFSSRFNELSSAIDSAEPEQLPALESQLGELKAEMESSSQNRYGVLLSSVCLPVFIVLVIIVAIVAYVVLKRGKRG